MTTKLVEQLDKAAAASLACAPQHIHEHLCSIAARRIEALSEALAYIHDWSAIGADMGDPGLERINAAAKAALDA